MSWVVFTDLDGTLLDHESYSWEGADPALETLRQRRIPVVLCTSKTWAETSWLQGRMGIQAPAVVENGGGVHDGEDFVALGTPHVRVMAVFREIQAACPGLRGMNEMGPEEVARRTGLPLEAAALAKRREFDEPFVVEAGDAAVSDAMREMAAKRGMQVSHGGRFFHLHGAADKGLGVREVRRRLSARLGEIRALGLGDSEVDASLLAEVEEPILMPKPSGRVDAALAERFPLARRAPSPGPVGWAAAVLHVVGAR